MATLHKINRGATTDFLYRVDVRRRGFGWYHPPLSVFGCYGTGRSNCAYGVNLRWLDDRTLDISYLDSRYIEVPAMQRFDMDGKPLAVRVRSGVNDPKAPCGSVEYNLKNGPL